MFANNNLQIMFYFNLIWAEKSIKENQYYFLYAWFLLKCLLHNISPFENFWKENFQLVFSFYVKLFDILFMSVRITLTVSIA